MELTTLGNFGRLSVAHSKDGMVSINSTATGRPYTLDQSHNAQSHIAHLSQRLYGTTYGVLSCVANASGSSHGGGARLYCTKYTAIIWQSPTP
jgi:hypothetical protein